MVKLNKEHFTSIHGMLDTLNKRPNNSIMQDEHSSNTGGYGFTETKNYAEAVKLFRNGYTDILDKIKRGFNAEVKINGVENRRNVRTGVIGYAPHVPNAILGLPNSMILTESQPQKTKAIDIIYDMCGNASVDADTFIKSGVAVLGVVNTLELQGVRVKLRVAFFCAKKNDEYCFATVDVKDYREHLDLQKLCFPIAHPSMFRRFGFKWLETYPDLTEQGYRCGYGKDAGIDEVQKYYIGEHERYICWKTCKDNDYDVHDIIDSLDLK